MICSFCRREFQPEQARKQCKSCGSSHGCRQIRCPYCHYEMPEEPALVKRIRNWLAPRIDPPPAQETNPASRQAGERK